ncbi:MAG: 6-carboxytetrahydropterin synthase [Chromatiaceae bacterium]|nr:MAG: 6-carboxytetrahydropterin synthase [Chromatiaceae bacterium]
MYTVNVRDHMMIAHSFSGETFGPAQRLHGATYVVDACFKREALDEENLVVDIGRASEMLHEILGEFNYRNLDEVEAFQGQNTTTEFMARVIFDRLAGAIREGRLGASARNLSALAVTLHESHVAQAGFEGPL